MTTALTTADRQQLTLRNEIGQVVAVAGRAGVELECLGVHPLFTGIRLYTGAERSWVLAPAGDDPHLRRGELALPKPERRAPSPPPPVGAGVPRGLGAPPGDPAPA